jgi:hypothetical protein
VHQRIGETLGAEPGGLLRRRLRRVLARVDADAVRAKAARARSQRSLRRTAFGLGVDEWSAMLPVEQSRAAWSVVDTLARSYLAQGRCTRIEAARADALLDLIHARATGRVELNLTVPASALAAAAAMAGAAAGVGGAGTDDAGQTGTGSGDPGSDDTGAQGSSEGAGHDGAGPGSPWGSEGADGVDELVPVTGFGATGTTLVPASWLAALAAGAAAWGCGTSVVACADRTGALVSLPVPAGTDRAARRRAQGTARRRARRLARAQARGGAGEAAGRSGTDEPRVEPYRPPEWMVRFVRARDGGCRFHGCTVPARSCDLDHVRPWPGGPTHPDNLVCLCRRHHRIKQRRGWRAVLGPDGTLRWTDPTGSVRTTTPLDHLHLDDQDGATPPAAAADAVPRGPRVAAAVELPSLLEEELEHAHDHHLIHLSCRPPTLTWRTRHALQAGTRIGTTGAAAALHATTAAGIELLPTRIPMQVDRDSPHWHGPPNRRTPPSPPDDPPPF